DFDIRIKNADSTSMEKFFIKAADKNVYTLHLTEEAQELFKTHCKALMLPGRSYPNFSLYSPKKTTDYLHSALTCNAKGEIVELVPGALEAARLKQLITLEKNPEDNYLNNLISLYRG